MSATLELAVETGDITTTAADVVLLKHAQGFYGADGAVATRLATVKVPHAQLEVAPGAHRFVATLGALTAPTALFVGTPDLGSLGYHEIRVFAARALTALEARPDVRTLACTAHGTSFGLDLDEAALALVGGFVEAFQRGAGPPNLARITVVERHRGRSERLAKAIAAGLGGASGVTAVDGGFRVTRSAGFLEGAALATAGAQSTEKPHAFVAMPFTPELEDVYHYGILGPVRATGLLCERVDQTVYDGLIVHRILERIASAKVVIAELSGANPNVYLEVGYAWGKGAPTVLVVKDLKELRFDVAGHRCLVYKNIRDLEERLTRELAHLR